MDQSWIWRTTTHISDVIIGDEIKEKDGTLSVEDYWHCPPLSQDDLRECVAQGEFLHMELAPMDGSISIVARPAARVGEEKNTHEKDLDGARRVKALWDLRINMRTARLLAGALQALIRLHELTEDGAVERRRKALEVGANASRVFFWRRSCGRWRLIATVNSMPIADVSDEDDRDNLDRLTATKRWSSASATC